MFLSNILELWILPYLNSFGKTEEDKIKRKVIVLDYDQGGLRAPSIHVLSKSLKLAWISRLLAGEHKSGQSWKAIPNYIFERYGDLNFILRCNYDKKFLDQIGLPQFYKLIVLYVLELKEPFPNQSGQEQILFNNKDILIHLLKLEYLLRWSLFTFIYNRGTNMNYFMCTSHVFRPNWASSTLCREDM